MIIYFQHYRAFQWRSAIEGQVLALVSQLLPMPKSTKIAGRVRDNQVSTNNNEFIDSYFFPFYPATDRRYWDGTEKFSIICNQTAFRDRNNHASNFIRKRAYTLPKPFFKEPNSTSNPVTEHQRSIPISTSGISP